MGMNRGILASSRAVLAAGIAFMAAWTGIVHAETLQVVTEEMPPFNYTKYGVITGVGTEVVRAVLDAAGLTGEFQSLPWARAYKKAQEEPNVLIYSIGRNPERESLFQWGGAIAPVTFHFYRLESRGDIRLVQPEDAANYRIGAVLGDYTTEFLISKGIEKTRLDMATSSVFSLRKLLLGRVDLILIEDMTLAFLIRAETHRQEVEKIGRLAPALAVPEISGEMYMAFSLKTPSETVERCRTALDVLKKKGEWDRILSTYIQLN